MHPKRAGVLRFAELDASLRPASPAVSGSAASIPARSASLAPGRYSGLKGPDGLLMRRTSKSLERTEVSARFKAGRVCTTPLVSSPPTLPSAPTKSPQCAPAPPPPPPHRRARFVPLPRARAPQALAASKRGSVLRVFEWAAPDAATDFLRAEQAAWAAVEAAAEAEVDALAYLHGGGGGGGGGGAYPPFQSPPGRWQPGALERPPVDEEAPLSPEPRGGLRKAQPSFATRLGARLAAARGTSAARGDSSARPAAAAAAAAAAAGVRAAGAPPRALVFDSVGDGAGGGVSADAAADGVFLDAILESLDMARSSDPVCRQVLPYPAPFPRPPSPPPPLFFSLSGFARCVLPRASAFSSRAATAHRPPKPLSSPDR